MRDTALWLSLFCCAVSHAAGPTSNDALRALKEQDQSVRSGNSDTVNWSKVTAEDAERRDAVTRMLRDGEVKTAAFGRFVGSVPVRGLKGA